MEVSRILADFERERAARSNFDSIYQIIGEYIHQNKQNFEVTPDVGEFLNGEIYDSTGTFAAYNSASTLLGMLWPGSAKQSIEITPPEDMKNVSTGLAQFYDKMTERACQRIDDPNANLSIALDEYMLDQVCFATSGVGVDYDSGLIFRPYGTKEVYVKEGKNGRPNGLYIFDEWPADRLAEEYGAENLSDKTKKILEGNGQEMVKIVQCVQARKEKKAQKGKLSLPYENIIIEYESKKVIYEGGFNELPIKVCRFRKLSYEKYGRSPAMAALPDIMEANALREAIILATEKNLDPPLGIMNDGMLGGGVIDTSAKAINVFNGSGALDGKSPVFPLVTVGNLTDALARLEKLEQTIAQHFSIDRLLDMNNETRMTFGEAQIRNAIRMASLQSLFARQITELFTPLMERSIRLLWENGEFGVIRGTEQEQILLSQGTDPEYIPDELLERIQKGQDVYQIRYKTQAVNASRAQEYMAIMEVMTAAGQVVAVDPSIRHRIDFHQAIEELSIIRGLPVGIIRQDDETQALIQQEAQQQQAQMALQAGQQVAQISKDVAQAQK